MKWVFEQPTSGRFLNEMPGVSFRQLENINDLDNESLLTVWKSISHNAATGFLFDLKGKLGVTHRMRSGFPVTEKLEFSKELAKESGRVVVEQFNLSKNLHFGRLLIRSIALKSELLGEVTVSVETPTAVLYEQTHLVGNTPTVIELNVSVETRYAKEVTVYAESSVLLEKVTQQRRYYDCAPCTVKPIRHGLVDASLSCDLSLYLEDNQDYLLYPYMHRLALEFLKERIGSDRVNRFTTLNEEKAKDLYNKYEDDYHKLLDSYVAGMKSADCICFEKNTPMYSVQTLVP
jgi:hypothetical protein